MKKLAEDILFVFDCTLFQYKPLLTALQYWR